MKVEFEKKMHIVSDLLAYCHTQGAKNFNLDMNESESKTIINLTAYPVKISDAELAKVRKLLSAPRSYEIETNYWGLSGESESKAELMLVGMMTDNALVECDGDDNITITLTRLA